MTKCLCTLCIAMLLILTIPYQSLLFAEIYQWNDTDGSIHLSNNPTDIPKGKKPIVRNDGSSNNISSPLKSEHSTVPLNYSLTSSTPSWKKYIEPACNQEYKEATNYCESASSRPDLKNISPLDRRSETERCVHKRVNARCKEQYDKALRVMQEETNKCVDTRQKIYRICGYPQHSNQKCHGEHMAELEAACNIR
jgi:hypothetical protein